MIAERKSAYFGPGGNSDNFRLLKKTTIDAPAWLAENGLDAYEYEAGRGFTASSDVLTLIGQNAKAAGIYTSVHAPYFISLSGVVTETRLKSISYIAESLHAAECLGSKIIVVHTGSAAKITRSEAMALAKDTLYKTLEAIPNNGVFIGLETMGKINQLGTLEEVIELCTLDKRLQPVVDFGHMNARELGKRFQTEDDYLRVFEQIEKALGLDSAKNLHCHFSKIEWTSAGEKRHLTLEDDVFGPDFRPLMHVIRREGLTPTIISESAGTQAEDAYLMKQYYQSI